MGSGGYEQGPACLVPPAAIRVGAHELCSTPGPVSPGTGQPCWKPRGCWPRTAGTQEMLREHRSRERPCRRRAPTQHGGSLLLCLCLPWWLALQDCRRSFLLQREWDQFKVGRAQCPGHQGSLPIRPLGLCCLQPSPHSFPRRVGEVTSHNAPSFSPGPTRGLLSLS